MERLIELVRDRALPISARLVGVYLSVKKEPALSISAISRELGLEWHTTSKALEALERRGYLRVIRRRGRGIWIGYERL